MLNIGPQELLLILVIALIVVGPQRLPTLGRSIGRGLREIRKTQDDVRRTIQMNLDDETVGNGDAGSASKGDRDAAAPSRGARRTRPAAPTSGETPAAGDPAPTASEPPSASEVREISRTLGRSLAEIRRAREEVQRSFRVDVNPPDTKPSRRAPDGQKDPGSTDGGPTDAGSTDGAKAG